MPKVTYIGDPSDDYSGPSEIEVVGQVFTKGEEATVTDKQFEKLSGHSHFTTEGQEAPDPDQARGAAMTMDELRAVLDDKGVEYKKNQGRATLVNLIVENGGFPAADEEE